MQAPISPADFARRMKAILAETSDPRQTIALWSALMATTLFSIGYAEGVEIWLQGRR